jgi:serine phosphatase RsbU (regulator of sigma subunit)
VTIRRRLTLSFAIVLVLFGISLAVYSWSARLHDVTMRRLDRTLQRRVFLATIRQEVDNLQKQVALLSQSELAEGSPAAPNPRTQQLFDEKLQTVNQQIADLRNLSEPEDAASLAELQSNFTSLSQSWKAFHEYLGVEPTWAVASAAKADPLGFRLLTEILPRLQEVENRRVEMAEASFSQVQTLTRKLTSITFIASLLFAAMVAIVLSRSIVRGFSELQRGADLIGGMHLGHRIGIKSKDELGLLAHSFNTMTERLELARKQLTEANEELARRNEEIKQRQAKELEMAATIQHGLMEVRIPDLPFASIRARNIPCTEIGGDFYDVVPVEGGVAVIICDVSGKGISAAIMASMLQGMIRSELAAKLPLHDIVTHANRFFTQRDVAGKYATVCIFRLEADGTLDYVNCGHIPPVLITAGGIGRLESSNPPVGLLPEVEYRSARTKLLPDQRIVLVTDGVTEASTFDENMFGDELFGDERLELAAAAEDPFEAVFAEVAKFCGNRALDDDCTVVEIAYRAAATQFESGVSGMDAIKADAIPKVLARAKAST